MWRATFLTRQVMRACSPQSQSVLQLPRFNNAFHQVSSETMINSWNRMMSTTTTSSTSPTNVMNRALSSASPSLSKPSSSTSAAEGMSFPFPTGPRYSKRTVQAFVDGEEDLSLLSTFREKMMKDLELTADEWMASSTVKKRRLKMNKHKYRKRRKRDRQRSK